jgi:hypothetical protein
MYPLTLARDYFVWHYTDGIVDLLSVFGNFFWAVAHMFSVKGVVVTLFAPWKRLQEQPRNVLKDPQGFFADLAVNLIMRLVGAVIRVAVICIALVCWAILFAGFLTALIAWILMPYLLLALFVSVFGVFVT